MTPTTKPDKPIHDHERRREVIGILLLGVAIFIGLSIGSLQLGSGTLMGPFGAAVGLSAYALLGVAGYGLALGIGVLAVRCLLGRALGLRSFRSLAIVLGALAFGILVHVALGRYRLRGYSPGGLAGEYGAELLASLVGRVGAVLFAVITLAASLVLTTRISFKNAIFFVGRSLAAAARASARWLWTVLVAVFPERGEREAPPGKRGREATLTDTAEEVGDADVLESVAVDKADKPERARRRDKDGAQVVALAAARVAKAAKPAEDGAPVAIEDAEPTVASIAPPQHDDDAPTPRIVEMAAPAAPKIKEAAAPRPDYIPSPDGYHLPQIDLLDEAVCDDSERARASREEMLALAEKLQRTLGDYGVRGHVQEIHPGPVVTMYEFVPQAGTKLSKITSLSNDLAMALAALRVRIVAPIPGKSSVGIEVPNKVRATVYLREILAADSVARTRSRLTMGLGKDISGAPVAVDLAKMPHLLVAGTTGSGKSVGINGMIASILFSATPEEVRMIMIDPKMVELSVYEGIPHLLLPVVTDPKKANLALRWAVEEMERRYESVSKSGVRDIVSYNKKMEKLLAEGPPPPPEPKRIRIWVEGPDGKKREEEVVASAEAVAAAGGVVTEDVRDDISAAHAALHKAQLEHAAEPPPRKLPYIVVVIDEFADLMMVAPKDVETSVARIAQKARAVGIHLIVATQRPSVDVITGLIKANFPSRIGYQVASKIDSRTILDQQGAENLLGNGDMLFTDRGQALKRIHGAFVSDDEVKRLVAFLQKQGKPVYDLDILKPRDDDGDGQGGDGLPEDSGSDPLYDQAVRLVCDTRMASVSMIQRRLQIGFNRAARLVERMEKDGIVGAANGSKPREVLSQAI